MSHYGPPRPLPRPPVPPDPAREFLRLWATASVAEHTGQYELGAIRFMAAAMIAPHEDDRTRALTRAFNCRERASLDVTADDATEPGYGHGV